MAYFLSSDFTVVLGQTYHTFIVQLFIVYWLIILRLPAHDISFLLSPDYYFILLIKRNCENNVHFQTPVQLQFKHRPSIPNLMSELVEGYLGHTINLT